MSIETLGFASFPSGRAALVDTGVFLELGEEAFEEEHGHILQGVGPGVFPVRGERVTDGEDAGSWRHVWVELGEARPTSSEDLGNLVVDSARLMFVDLDEGAKWDESEPLDGKADFLFWGRDAAKLAKETGARPAGDGDGQFGWVDRPLMEILELGAKAESVKKERGFKLATDFRPHTHHHRLLAQARKTKTGSGTIDLGGSKACLFFTTWGDGVFGVFVDRDAKGRIVRFRVDFAADD